MRTALDAEPHRAFPRQGPCRRRSGPTPRTSNGYRCGPVCQPGARGHGLPQPSRRCRRGHWNGGPGGVPAWRRLLRAVPAVWTPALVTERDRGLCGWPPWLKFLVHSETTHRFTWSQMASTPDRSHTPGAEGRRSAWISKDSKADTAPPCAPQRGRAGGLARGSGHCVACVPASKCGPARWPAFSLGSRRLSVSRGEAVCSGCCQAALQSPASEPPRLRHRRPWGRDSSGAAGPGRTSREHRAAVKGRGDRATPCWGARVGPASGSSYGLVQQGGDVLFLVAVRCAKHHHSILDGERVEVVQHDVVGLRQQGRITGNAGVLV